MFQGTVYDLPDKQLLQQKLNEWLLEFENLEKSEL